MFRVRVRASNAPHVCTDSEHGVRAYKAWRNFGDESIVCSNVKVPYVYYQVHTRT